MADPIRITKKDYTLLGMQTKLRNIEAAFVEIESLEIETLDNGVKNTIAMVNNVAARPKRVELRLGNPSPPAGTTSVCQGEVLIQNNTEKVTLFRSTS